MLSSEWRKRADELGRLAQKAQSLMVKQKLMAQQQKCLAMARASGRREQAEAAHAPPVPAAEESSTRTVPEQPSQITRPQPPDLVKSSPFLMRLWQQGIVPPSEIERRARCVEQLRERLSATPYHAHRAAHDPDYWNKLYDSRVNW